ncbi:MAG: hypothetical protein KJ930_11445, partial [Gammaproteobacteria bacterium]|nr:hypothetical protein [Gammaproteobacteria bacterium]
MRSAKDWRLQIVLPFVIALTLGGWLFFSFISSDSALPDAIQPHPFEQLNSTVKLAPDPNATKHSSALTTTSATTPPQNLATAQASCAAESVMQQQLRQILQQRKQQSYQLIQQLAENGTKPADIASIIHQLGGDMVLLAQQRPDYPANPNTLIRFEQQPRTISQQLALQLQQAVLSQNYQQIVQVLQADPDPAQLAWHGQTLLTAILAADPNISLLTLQQLTDSGLQPVFADLVAATSLQLPVPLVDVLNMAFAGNRQQLWFHQYRRNNLTLLAAAEGNVGLYDYWLAQGVPAYISAADLNAFDVLPFPTTESELRLRLPFIRNFVKQGLLPRQFTSLNSWLLLLPTDEALQLSEQLASSEQGRQGHIQQLGVTDLSEGIINTNQLFKQHILARHQCNQLYQLGSALLLLDDADQNYGLALKARFRVDAEQVRVTAQLLT